MGKAATGTAVERLASSAGTSPLFFRVFPPPFPLKPPFHFPHRHDLISGWIPSGFTNIFALTDPGRRRYLLSVVVLVIIPCRRCSRPYPPFCVFPGHNLLCLLGRPSLSCACSARTTPPLSIKPFSRPPPFDDREERLSNSTAIRRVPCLFFPQFFLFCWPS